MSKTVAISDDVHILIAEKQIEIFKKYRISVKLSDITDAAIKCGIDRVDKVLVHASKLKIIDDDIKDL